MASRRNVLHERFFTALISGDRDTARSVVAEALEAECTGEQIINQLFWPTLEHVQTMYRNDQMTPLCYNFATRLLRGLVDQMQLRLEQRDRRGETALVMCGPEESEELAAQMASDLLEADGYTVHFIGGGIANDELVAQIGERDADKLVIFGAIPATVPMTRLLIDRLHEIGVCQKLQIIVGGGVFNRAEGLAEEIGADLWANSPEETVLVISEEPDRRMSEDQRTVGRKRRSTPRRKAIAA